MAKQGALKPQAYEDIQEIWRRKDQTKAVESGIDPEDQELFTMSTMPGWTRLKEHINNMKVGLDQRLAESVLGSMSGEQIKTDALFAVLGKRLLDSIINKVEDSALVVDDTINGKAKSGE